MHFVVNRYSQIYLPKMQKEMPMAILTEKILVFFFRKGNF